MTVSRGRITGPRRDSLADELAAFANANGGTLVLGVEDRTRRVIGVPRPLLDDAERLVADINKLNVPNADATPAAVLRIDVPRGLFVHKSPGGYLRRENVITTSQTRERLIERLRMTGVRKRPVEEALVIAASVLVAVVIIGCDIGHAGSGGTRTAPQDMDKDGCWHTAPACVSVKIEGDGHGGVRSTVTNGCGGRIYVRICNKARGISGGSSCGSFGIRAGGSLRFYTPRHEDPTGRAHWQWVGSSEPGNDWLCSGVVDGWFDPPAFGSMGDG